MTSELSSTNRIFTIMFLIFVFVSFRKNSFARPDVIFPNSGLFLIDASDDDFRATSAILSLPYEDTHSLNMTLKHNDIDNSSTKSPMMFQHMKN